MARSRVFVTVTAAAFTLLLLRCAQPFAPTDSTPAAGTDGGEAGAAAEAAAEAGPISDGGADGSEADADARPPATTCAELQDAGTGASGIYTIKGIERYCEMTLAGGGWTLIARSANGASGNFGWKQSVGTVSTDGTYSLDARTIGSFTALLFGKRGTGNSLVPPIYTKPLPPDFLASYATSADTKTTTTIDGGGCVPNPGGPLMLQYVGFTDAADHYFFRDNNTLAIFGLTPNGWVSATGCSAGGDLDMEQGAIFVR